MWSSFLNKLRHEWKTAALGVAATLLELYDSLLAPFLSSNPLIPEKYKWIDALVIPMAFLFLRKWVDKNVH